MNKIASITVTLHRALNITQKVIVDKVLDISCCLS